MVERSEEQSEEQTDRTSTRARILRAAAAEFARYGFAGARVDRIAQDAQANKRLIYHHFQSKEGLCRATLERALDTADARNLTPQHMRLLLAEAELGAGSSLTPAHLDMDGEDPAARDLAYVLFATRALEVLLPQVADVCQVRGEEVADRLKQRLAGQRGKPRVKMPAATRR